MPTHHDPLDPQTVERHFRFDEIDVVESRVRRYGAAAVVTGRTRMRGRMNENGWAVIVEQAGRWRLASAQGTPVAAP